MRTNEVTRIATKDTDIRQVLTDEEVHERVMEVLLELFEPRAKSHSWMGISKTIRKCWVRAPSWLLCTLNLVDRRVNITRNG